MESLFKEILGQEKVAATLAANLSDNRLASAYLFSGASGMGKIKTALIFAKAILCASPGTENCLCNSCRLFDSGSHPDFMAMAPTESKSKNPDFAKIIRNPEELGAAQAGRMIKVEQVRNVISALSIKSYFGQRKVCVVEGADTMNKSTANAFLKTLEEPPPETVIIMVSSNPAGLLPTVVSRCRVIRFVPMEAAKLAALLEEKRNISPEEALRVAELAEGRPVYAFDDSINRAKEIDDEAWRILSRLTEMRPHEIVRVAEQWKTRREDIPVLLQRLMEAIRICARPNSASLSDTMSLALNTLGKAPPERLVDGYYSVLEIMPALVYNPNVQLLLEAAFFNLQSVILKGELLADGSY